MMIKKFPSFLIFPWHFLQAAMQINHCFNLKLKDLQSNTNVILICFGSRPSINILKLNIHFVNLTLSATIIIQLQIIQTDLYTFP